MATTISPYLPNPVLAPFPVRTAAWNPILLQRTRYCYSGLSHRRPSLRGSLTVARLGFDPGFFPDPHNAEGVLGELLGRAESILYTVADAAVSHSDTVTNTTTQSNDWFSGITYYMEFVLKVCYLLREFRIHLLNVWIPKVLYFSGFHRF